MSLDPITKFYQFLQGVPHQFRVREISDISEYLFGKKLTPNVISKSLGRGLEKMVRALAKQEGISLREATKMLAEGLGVPIEEIGKSLPTPFIKEICEESNVDYESLKEKYLN